MPIGIQDRFRFSVWGDTVDGRNPALPGMYKSL